MEYDLWNKSLRRNLSDDDERIYCPDCGSDDVGEA